MNTQNTIPFSIEAYQELVVEKGTHEVRTTVGCSVRILCTNAMMASFVIAGLIRNKDEYGELDRLVSWNKDGDYQNDGTISKDDLVIVPKPPKSLGWVVIYKFDVVDRVVCTQEPFKTLDDLVAWAKVSPIILLSEPVEIFEKPKAP